MSIPETVDSRAFSSHVRAVGATSRQRMKSASLKRTIRGFFFAAEYIGYIVTFYILMAIRVIPDYQGVNANLLSWIRELPVVEEYGLFLLMFLVIHAFSLVQGYLFSGKAERSFMEEYWFFAKSIVYAFLITIGITFLLKTTFIYSRVTLVTFVLLILVESMLWRGAYWLLIRYLNQKGTIRNHVLIIGAGKVGSDILEQVNNAKSNNNYFVGFLDDYKTGDGIIGRTDQLESILQQQRIDTIYITIPSERQMIESIIHAVYKYNVDIRIIPEMYDRMATVFTFRKDLEYPCMQIVKTPLRGINIVLKRIADILGSLLLLVLLSPLFVLIGIWIKLDTKGPIFFRQQRIGKHGIPFQMLKFRSMHQEAERMKQALMHVNEVNGPVFKLRNDPRITRAGRWLRKYSLDELPQLWNVLKGEMSLIGPRPPLPQEVAQYTNYHWRRLDVLPGMTGLWQVSGRSDLDFEEWVDLDIYYIERWSLGLEMKILLRTIPVVLKGTGAY
ncbi:MAG: exopolysaccharide biosynthesis polyprenyl glycosylphosphotransferase [Cohnella sp.]|uniref:sugar transferase n=1 Tax=Cohnella sp. TaxID=1883426 RepID=UPI000E3AC2AF|nr:sugar transferase [Cohnella sp.]REK66510.1 MAG: exopolysaccharide biosynthesis polyprenyl glycosylphosphotransferase [Cohnella sp.]